MNGEVDFDLSEDSGLQCYLNYTTNGVLCIAFSCSSSVWVFLFLRVVIILRRFFGNLSVQVISVPGFMIFHILKLGSLFFERLYYHFIFIESEALQVDRDWG